MDIVEREHQRPGAGEPLQQVAQHPVRPVAVSLPALARRLGERGQRDRERRRVREPEPRQPPLAQRIQVAVERIAPERVGQVALELRRPAAEHHASAAARL